MLGRALLSAGVVDPWILDHESGDFDNERFNKIPSPKEIHRALGEYMIGQHEARRTLAVAVHNHYKRAAIRDARGEKDRCNLVLAATKIEDEKIAMGRPGSSPRAGNPHVAPPSGSEPIRVVEPDPTQTPQEQAQNILEQAIEYPPYPPNAGPPAGTKKINDSDDSFGGQDGDVHAMQQSAVSQFMDSKDKDSGLADAPAVRLRNGSLVEGCEVEKSNILLLGPTGSGKTLAAKTLAGICQVPLVICDATALTQAGYVGDDVETIIYKLYAEADYNVEAAQRGIVYLDEIDKIARRSPGLGPGGFGRDVGGEGVQQALLKLLEGTIVNVPKEGSKKTQKSDTVPIDTSEILFIGAGAFSGLDNIIENRIAKSSIGFNAQLKRRDGELSKKGFMDPKAPHVLDQVEPQDLGDYGLLPEFIGRFPVVTATEALDEDALVQVLTKPKNALCKQYSAIFSFSDCELHMMNSALRELARQAKERGTGARGLRSIMEKLLQNAMFEVPESDVTGVIVDAEAVKAASQGTPPAVYVEEEEAKAEAATGLKLLKNKTVKKYLEEMKAEGALDDEEDLFENQELEATPLRASG